jgi:acyl carrier protein
MEETNTVYKIEILQLIESKYSIEIGDEEVEDITTLDNLINLIRSKLKNK